jgi:stress-induced-phosphoprotein 1
LYSKAIENDTTNHVYYSNRSAAYAGLKNWDKALEDADKCIQINKNWSKVSKIKI